MAGCGLDTAAGEDETHRSSISSSHLPHSKECAGTWGLLLLCVAVPGKLQPTAVREATENKLC